MIQHFHVWAYTQKHRKQGLRQIHVHPCSLRCYSRQPKGRNDTSVSIGGGRDTQHVGYAANGISFSLKKEGSLDAGFDVDEPGGHGAKGNKPGTEGRIVYDSTHTGDLEGANS